MGLRRNVVTSRRVARPHTFSALSPAFLFSTGDMVRSSVRDFAILRVVPQRYPCHEHCQVNTLIASRCSDGTYLLAPTVASVPEHASVEFLGEVAVNSFKEALALSIKRQIARWNFALISKDEFLFSWPNVQAHQSARRAVAAPRHSDDRSLLVHGVPVCP